MAERQASGALTQAFEALLSAYLLSLPVCNPAFGRISIIRLAPPPQNRYAAERTQSRYPSSAVKGALVPPALERRSEPSAAWPISAAALALIFATALVSKLSDPSATLRVFDELLGLPMATAKSATVGLIVAEALLAGWLLCGQAPRAAFATVATVLVAFTLLLLWQWRVGWTGGCGCGAPRFGPEAERTFGLVRNAAGLGLCWLGWREGPQGEQTVRSPFGVGDTVHSSHPS